MIAAICILAVLVGWLAYWLLDGSDTTGNDGRL